jgi:hypothetical protein
MESWIHGHWGDEKMAVAREGCTCPCEKDAEASLATRRHAKASISTFSVTER